MDFYTIAASVLTMAIIATYINERFIKLPTTIAIMASSLLLSLLVIIFGRYFNTHFGDEFAEKLSTIDFHALLMNGMLSFLLFAGALHVDISRLKAHKWEIGVLATFSTVLSAILIAVVCYYLLPLLGVNLSFIYCLLFGALISPTDPIAVLATFKELNAPKNLDVKVAGESLFNDGVGIVMFLSIYQVAFSNTAFDWQNVTLLFVQQALGGIAYGAALGFITSWLIKPIDNHKVVILMTIMVATGGYALAQQINISGALAMVVAGIFIGNHGRNYSMSTKSRESLDNFWEIIDEILNAALFLLIGFELLVLEAQSNEILVGCLMIPLVLSVRFITVAIPMTVFKQYKTYVPYTIRILVWGGLRGGLAVALALALPASHDRSIILVMTYAVVMFSVLVQGLTIKPLVEKSKQPFTT
ncbi:MAG: sodium:proton antiporter [Pseudomonadota bacterium]|nr:sodium:proton antiporter [Pseudomonadota bacterium]